MDTTELLEILTNRRAVKAYPAISFEDCKTGNWFKATITLPSQLQH